MGNETSVPQSEPHTAKPTLISVHRNGENRISNHSETNHKVENGNDNVVTSAPRVSGETDFPLESPRKLLPYSPNESNRRAPNKNDVTILRGIVVGKEQTGKTSLIRRLRGEDPFDSQVQRRETGNGQKLKRNLMALVPWKFPYNLHPGLTVDHEDVVQLYVSEGRSFQTSFLTASSSDSDETSHDTRKSIHQIDATFRKEWLNSLRQQNGKELDFVIWVIDPRMNNFMEFLTAGLCILFPPSSGVEECKGHGDERIDSTHKSEMNDHVAPLVHNLCILLNFRDTHSPKVSNSMGGTTLENVRQLAKSILQKHSQFADGTNGNASKLFIKAKQPTIVVYESSMRNCYGLQQLHSFIALPYLCFKEREYLKRAEYMRNGHQKWKDRLMQFDVVGFDEFSRELNEETVSTINMEETLRQTQQGDLSKSSQHGSATGPASDTENAERVEQKAVTEAVLSVQRGKMKNSEHSKREKSSTKESKNSDAYSSSIKEVPEPKIEEPSAPPNVGPRKLFNSLHQPMIKSNAWTPMDIAGDTLDSFFADDESLNEEDGTKENDIRSSNSPKRKDKAVLNSDDSSNGDISDDDSDDDDFYIDNSGNRHSHSRLDNRVTKPSRPETSNCAMTGTISLNYSEDEQSTSDAEIIEKERGKNCVDERAKSIGEMKSDSRKSSPTKSHSELELQKDSLYSKTAPRPVTPTTKGVDKEGKVSQQNKPEFQPQISDSGSCDEVHCVADDTKLTKDGCTEKCQSRLSVSRDVDDSSNLAEDSCVHSSETEIIDAHDNMCFETESPLPITRPAIDNIVELADTTDESATKPDNDDAVTACESNNSSGTNRLTTMEESFDSSTNETLAPTFVNGKGSKRDQSVEAADSFEVNGFNECQHSSNGSKSMKKNIETRNIRGQTQSTDNTEVDASDDSSSHLQNINSTIHVEEITPSTNNNAIDNTNSVIVSCNKSMVLGSDDDESIGSQKDSVRDIKGTRQGTLNSNSDVDDEFVIDESVMTKSMRPESTPSNHIGDSIKGTERKILQQQPAKPPSVSNAALAAIEAAKREAERMMTKSQSSLVTSEVGTGGKDKSKSEKKKSKKSSISVDGEKKKKKKEKEKKKKEKKAGS